MKIMITFTIFYFLTAIAFPLNIIEKDYFPFDKLGAYLAGAFSPLVLIWLIYIHFSESKKSNRMMEFLIEERKNKLISNLPEFYFSDIAFNYKNENYYNDKDLIVAK
ncbi:MAG: hypothetical protein HWE24_15290 [Oceanospirillaceae bacterium]|nr:hypothetical protein [Oceanospirillaceae bacterium]